MLVFVSVLLAFAVTYGVVAMCAGGGELPVTDRALAAGLMPGLPPQGNLLHRVHGFAALKAFRVSCAHTYNRIYTSKHVTNMINTLAT